MKVENLNEKNWAPESIIAKTNEELNNLRGEIWKNDINKEPNVIKINNYEINNYWSYFSIDINDDYWLTIKKVEGELVFDAKHEWFISKEDYPKLNDNQIIDNWNIDMINMYLNNCNLTLITNEEDIKILNNLFEKIQ